MGISYIRGHLVKSRDILGCHNLVCSWHPVGRGQGCYSTFTGYKAAPEQCGANANNACLRKPTLTFRFLRALFPKSHLPRLCQKSLCHNKLDHSSYNRRRQRKRLVNNLRRAYHWEKCIELMIFTEYWIIFTSNEPIFHMNILLMMSRFLTVAIRASHLNLRLSFLMGLTVPL